MADPHHPSGGTDPAAESGPTVVDDATERAAAGVVGRFDGVRGSMGSLFRAASAAILVEDEAGRVADANPAAEARFGSSQGDLQGLEVAALLAQGARRSAGLPGGTGGDPRSDGDEAGVGEQARGPVEAARLPITVNGRAATLVVIADPAVRSTLLDQLMAAQKMAAIGTLVSGLAHQINNPLTVVRGYGDMIAKDLEAGPQTREDASRIVEAAEQVRRLVGAFADLARERDPAPARLRLADVVATVRDLMRHDLMAPIRPRSGHVRLEVDLPPDLPDVIADRSGVELVLVTLVQNAIDAFAAAVGERDREAGPIGTIRITADLDPDGRRVGLIVADDGPGIAVTVVGRLFAPFVTSKPGGRGLGLWAAARRAAAGGGSLDPVAVDHGASFRLALPSAAQVSNTPPPPTPGRWERPGVLRILAAEDDALLRTLLQRTIGANPDVALAIAADGAEAIDAVRADAFDVLILDRQMGRGPRGDDVLAAALELDPGYARRTIIVTGEDPDPPLGPGLATVDVAMASKPYRPAELLALARRLAAAATAVTTGSADESAMPREAAPAERAQAEDEAAPAERAPADRVPPAPVVEPAPGSADPTRGRPSQRG